MVPNAGCGLRREKVAAGGLEEFHHRLILKRGRIGYIDHNLSAGQSLFESFAGDNVDAAFARGRDNLMTTLAQNEGGLRADPPGAADNDDLHWVPSLLMIGEPYNSSLRVSHFEASAHAPAMTRRLPRVAAR